jgi:hypothetical protein
MTLRTLLPLGLAFLLGCPVATTPALDTSGVGAATYGVDYTGAVTLTDYDGPAAFNINAGSLPQGLSMDQAGAITGTPEWVETQTVELLITGLDGADDLVGSITIEVNTDGLDVALGFEHDQLNNFYDDFDPPRMDQIWLRISGAGVTDQSDWTMNPGIYLPGPNGEHEAGIDRGHSSGAGDDVRIGDLDFRALEWTFTQWRPPSQPNTYPQDGYPSVHLPEGEPPTFTGRGVFSAHVDTGEAQLGLTHPDLPNTLETTLQLVPPDWCPNGQSDGPNLGVCE